MRWGCFFVDAMILSLVSCFCTNSSKGWIIVLMCSPFSSWDHKFLFNMSQPLYIFFLGIINFFSVHFLPFFIFISSTLIIVSSCNLYFCHRHRIDPINSNKKSISIFFYYSTNLHHSCDYPK